MSIKEMEASIILTILDSPKNSGEVLQVLKKHLVGIIVSNCMVAIKFGDKNNAIELIQAIKDDIDADIEANMAKICKVIGVDNPLIADTNRDTTNEIIKELQDGE